MKHRPTFDGNCQLCFAEVATTLIACVKIGDRCRTRVYEIAADAALEVAVPVQRARTGGIVCRDCGAELEVDEARLAITCPNGHAVVLVTVPPVDGRAGRRVAPSRVCGRCGQLVEREPHRRGTTPRFHAQCRTADELAELAARRVMSRAYYESHKSQWLDYGRRKRERERAAGAATLPAVAEAQSS